MTIPPDTEGAPDVLISASDQVRHEVHLDKFLQSLVDRIAAAMEADRGTLYLVDPAREELFSRAAHLPELSQIRLRIGQGAAGYVAKHGVVVNMPNPRGEPQFHPGIDQLTGYQTNSLLAVPLRDESNVLFGVLQVLNRRGQPRFSDEDEARLQKLGGQVATAVQMTSVYREIQRARQQPAAPVGYFFNRVVGDSEPMRRLYRVALKAAETDATVLIRGESGCGKELFARAMHFNSPRQGKPFIKVDCASLPASLIENELFGHEKGAFTGADDRVEGKFEAAEGGTVFIDELGELPLPVQGKLLRVLQDRELERVGGNQTIRVDVRIVAATNRDLVEMIGDGRFREDLYYRVKVLELLIPPLRERGGEDIERLVRHFILESAQKHRIRAPQLSSSALARLKSYSWPGNVRELGNCIESAVILCDGEIFPEHLALPAARLTGLHQTTNPDESSGAILPLAEVEKRHILAALTACDGNRGAAAKALGIGRNTLTRKLKSYGINEE